MQRALRYAVEAHYQLVGLSVGLPVLFDVASQRGDVAGIIVVPVDKTQFGNQPCAARPGIHGVKNAGGSGGGILRVGRQNQQTCHSQVFQHVKLRADRRAAIAHGVVHLDVVPALPQPALQQQGLFFSPQFQG